ncbi:ABC transporter ATP-binding protein [Rubrobacter aplysinae]|uniref:ABC transporter ATP-binding protein n=1 Tax=Rubrobacter aplysinae TaxID=909625 RepID=UPI00064BC74D|nr:phosphate ABC transporter ATP-binding protein [Rubrobacter aplysinae]
MTEKIRVEDLRYVRQGTEILAGVDVSAVTGEVTAVVGPSGAGKSTLLRAVNRLIEPTSGEVYLDGEPTRLLDTLALRRRVGMVLQLPALFGDTVEDAVIYGARLAGSVADVEALLDSVGLDGSLCSRDPQSLSVGQQQRVSVARALALRPQALLMDEPTSSLDEAARRGMEGMIRDLADRSGLTVMLVSHDLEQVRRVADSVVLLSAGQSVGQWRTGEFFSAAGREARRLVSGGS